MTSTWNRNLENTTTAFGDDAYGSHRGGRSYHYNLRNRRGQFATAVHVDQITVEGLPIWNAGGFGHGTQACAADHGTPVATDIHGAAFLCSHCVYVPQPVDDSQANCGKDGEMQCQECGDVKPVTKFPTKQDAGVKVRHDVCRQCRDAR